MSDAPVVSIADLTVFYVGADRPAIDGLDLEVAAGEFIGVIGLNGAGKTTLGLCLNGVVPHAIPAEVSGRLLVAGIDPRTRRVQDTARTVGVVFDNPEYQLSQLTVVEEVAFGLENLGVDPAEMPARIAEVLALVGLEDVEERSPLSLSGGQQQRLALASVLVMRPSVLFLDEPTAYLDPVGKADVLAIAARLHGEDGMAVIVADHEVEALAEIADRIVVLDAGRVVMDGPPAEVLARVEELAMRELRVPQVTQFAHELAPDAHDLPVTVEGALAWLGVG